MATKHSSQASHKQAAPFQNRQDLTGYILAQDKTGAADILIRAGGIVNSLPSDYFPLSVILGGHLVSDGALKPGVGFLSRGKSGHTGLWGRKQSDDKYKDAILGAGKVAGVLNISKIEQEDFFNGMVGISEFAGIANLGMIQQKGKLNLQLGIGETFGNVNFGKIKSNGYSAYLGFGLGFGIFNAGSIESSKRSSLTVGAGLANGIWNLGTLATSNQRDLVAGISGGVGLINGLATLDNTAAIAELASFTQSEINTRGGDDLIYGGGLYNVISFLASHPTDTGIAGLLPAAVLNDPAIQSLWSTAKSAGTSTFGEIINQLILSDSNLKDACWGIINFANLNTSTGNDTVFGAGDDLAADSALKLVNRIFPNHFGSGIVNTSTGTILLGDGDDKLRGETWAKSAPLIADRPPAGIINYGLIDGGNGGDIVSGYSGTSAPTNIGILNEGTITTGLGRDTVDALTGGFSGAGLTDLGLDDDTLIGFGSGRFNGGGGVSYPSQQDTLLLGDGTYACSFFGDAGGFFSLNKGATTMLVQGFELIGSAGDPGSAIRFFSGLTYEVLGNSITSYPTPLPG